MTIIIGLSPMDGVTDAPMRQITKKYGHVDLLTTEFVNVEGFHFAKKKLALELDFDDIERPIVAQIYGITPKYFAEATRFIGERGFDGVEINFGCPAKSVVHSGAGASMIKTPELAGRIIRAVQAAASEFPALPVSVKTRLGYDSNVASEWLKFLFSFGLHRVTLHGRTLKQGYTGQADWETIGQMSELRRREAPQTLFFGNGDVKTAAQARALAQTYHLDGVLIGRAAIGNPWAFTDETPSVATRIGVAIEHCRLYESRYGERPKFSIAPMRKHLSGYISHFPNSREFRIQLMQAPDVDAIARVLSAVDLSAAESS